MDGLASPDASRHLLRTVVSGAFLGFVLGILLFALESSTSHLLIALQLSDVRLTPSLWFSALGLYILCGTVVGLVVAAPFASVVGERGRALRRSSIAATVVTAYAIVLNTYRPGDWEWAPFIPLVLLVIIVWSATVTQHLCWPRHKARPAAGIQGVSNSLIFAPLLYLSLAPIVGLNAGKGSLQPSAPLLNVTLATAAAAAAVVFAELLRRFTDPGDRVSRRFLVLSLVTYAALMFMGARPGTLSGWSADQPRDTQRKDLVLIVVDSLRADRLGAYGYPDARTQNIDRIAARATLYANHMSAAPWTYPSMGSLLTGHSPSVHGAQRLSWPPDPSDQPGIPELGAFRTDLPTLATILRGHGYETAFIGSNWLLSRESGFDRGFDHYSDPLSTDFYVTLLLSRAETHRWNRSIPAREMTTRFIEYLGRQRTRPVALVAHYMDPHVPYDPPPRFVTASDDAQDESPSRMYDGEIAYVDDELGRLLRFLEESGRMPSTILGITSDHGEALPGVDSRNALNVVPLADRYTQTQLDHGHHLHQELLHVPFLLYSPELEPRIHTGVTRTIDVLPTLLDALGLSNPHASEGRSVLREAREALPALSESVLYGLEKKSWRRDAFKLIYRSGYPAESQFELYDLASDPGETRNLARSDAERAARLAGEMFEYLDRLPKVEHRRLAPTRETIERLRSLGYVK